MEIGEPKKIHKDIPKPQDIPELEPETTPQEPQKVEPQKKEEEIPA